MQTPYADTANAFDAHAAHYDAVVETNTLLHNMRAALWREVTRCVLPPARLLDLGCGTGIDAAYFARRGYSVTAIDASREMVNQTRSRIACDNLNVRVETLGAHELEKLGDEKFDSIYSDLGPLNCVENLRAVSQQCAALLKPRGVLIVSVMARVCPLEILYFGLRGEFQQAARRFSRARVPVNLEGGIVWTRYYDPREFFSFFAEFSLVTDRGLNVLLPPPYLERPFQHTGAFGQMLIRLDARLAALPFLRNMGDHFLMTLAKK